ncbi:GDSL-type esterase/lipase family protein [Acidobacteria bacterium AH-259-D05]|nr:GDSL-type esterase/lipase family protein [Acidobacteria bacterium AH-259-D05]
MIIEEPIGYRSRPNLRGEYYGVPVVINSLGLRDREISLLPDEDQYRVLVLGDSLIFGIGVKYENSIPYLLEQLLNMNRKTKLEFQTINMGVISYNTEQELVQLKTLGMKLHPNLVILLFAINDIEPKMWVFSKRRGWYTNLAQRSYAASSLLIVYRNIRTAISRPTKLVATENYRVHNPRWAVIDQSLTEMNSLCRSAGIPFIVFTDSLVPGSARDLIVSVGAREGFPVVNIQPWQDPRWKNEDRQKYRAPKAGDHPNEAGSKIYATLIYESLVKLGVVPIS